MRYLLGGIAAGKSVDDLVQQAHEGTGAELCDPPGAARAAGIGLGQAKAFLTGYITDFHGQLPVLTLDLQKFEDKTWTAGGISITDRVAWDKRMGWWGGPGAGGGTGPDNSRDYFITGLRLSGQGLRDGRPQFNPFDFLFNHLPSLTPSQEKAQDTLARMAEDAFWDPLLPEVKGPAGANSVRDAAHALLGKLRQELQTDYLFARKYGFVLFQGDKFGRSPTVMEE